jgi:multiple sugar transport system substrate-binding protein
MQRAAPVLMESTTSQSVDGDDEEVRFSMLDTTISRRNMVKAGVGAALGATAATTATTRRMKAAPRRQEEVQLTFAGIKMFGPDQIAALLSDFEAANPGITVQYIELPTPNNSTEVHTYLVNSLNAKNGEPDVFTQDCIWIPEFGGAGLALALDDFITDDDKAEYYPGLIENCTWDGKTVAWPWFVDGGFLYYRADLLDKHELAPPQSWDELVAAAQEIVANEGNPELQGFLWQAKQAEVLVCDWVEFLGSAGGSTLDGLEVTINNEAGNQALQFMHDLIYDVKITPEAVLTYDEEPSRIPFTSGNGVFLRNWSYVYNLAQDPEQSSVVDQVQFQPLPHFPDGKSTACLGGYQFGLNASSKHPEEAFKLMQFLSSEESQKRYALEIAVAPTRPAVYEDPELQEKNPFLVGLKEVFVGSTARPIHPGYPQMSLAIQSGLSGALANQMEVQEALDDIAQQLTDIIG